MNHRVWICTKCKRCMGWQCSKLNLWSKGHEDVCKLITHHDRYVDK